MPLDTVQEACVQVVLLTMTILAQLAADKLKTNLKRLEVWLSGWSACLAFTEPWSPFPIPNESGIVTYTCRKITTGSRPTLAILSQLNEHKF